MSTNKVELGRRLFYDHRLSVNGQGSCASCHQQRLAFSDGRAQAVGVTGERHTRSSMTLVNVAYNATYTWASRDVQTLEQQIPIPLFNEQPIELGLRGREDALVEALASDPLYRYLFEEAFLDSASPESKNPVDIENVIKALASFVRSIISADSAFDRRLFLDDQSALSASAIRGMRLFYSDEFRCGECHAGRNLAGGELDNTNDPSTAGFHNTGLYNLGGQNRYPRHDSGLRMETNDANDDGKFRAPTLRNIALTAPYMHDGSIETLSVVIDHYAAGGRSIEQGDYFGNGSVNIRKSPLLTGFELTDAEKNALLEFLDSLTDYSLLEDARFAAPEISRE
jgi:cytochrome c peroxidase